MCNRVLVYAACDAIETMGYGFQPTARGAASQGILVSTNAGDAAIQLTGLGVGPVPAASPVGNAPSHRCEDGNADSHGLTVSPCRA